MTAKQGEAIFSAGYAGMKANLSMVNCMVTPLSGFVIYQG